MQTMKPFRKTTMVLGGAVLLIGAVTYLTANGGNTPPSAPVTVVNTSANPVPVVQQGATTVSGNVTINGTPNVNVANSPTVHLASDASVSVTGTPTVNVANFPSGAYNPDQQEIVNASGSATIPDGFCCQQSLASGIYGVPFGKRLVIEHISAWATLPQGQYFIQAILSDDTGAGSQGSHYLALTPQSGLTSPILLPDGTTGLAFVANQPMKWRLDGGHSLSIRSLMRNSALPGEVELHVNVSGYLVSAP